MLTSALGAPWHFYGILLQLSPQQNYFEATPFLSLDLSAEKQHEATQHNNVIAHTPACSPPQL